MKETAWLGISSDGFALAVERPRPEDQVDGGELVRKHHWVELPLDVAREAMLAIQATMKLGAEQLHR